MKKENDHVFVKIIVDHDQPAADTLSVCIGRQDQYR